MCCLVEGIAWQYACQLASYKHLMIVKPEHRRLAAVWSVNSLCSLATQSVQMMMQ